MRREPKKTESIEIRVPHATKSAFMDACRQNGTSASAALRTFIERYVHSASRAPIQWKEELQMMIKRTSLRTGAAVGAAAVAVMTGVVATLFATPAKAGTDPLLAAVYDWMDANHDGKVTLAEFLSPARSEPLGSIGVVVDTKTRPANEAPKALFARLDKNQDGSISLAELSAQAIARTVLTPAIGGADSNGDGKIAESELAAYIAAQRATAGLREPSGGAALMAHGIIAQHASKGQDWVAVGALRN
jgi:antitoxin component of RelBE/YafQ-DinJ toxin-antitoxin module